MEQQQQQQQHLLQQSPELHGLADKLTAYIKRMRDLRSGRTHVDSLAFFQSVEAMEKEMFNLKNLYEREMDRMRQKVEELGRQKHHYQLQAEKNESLGLELRERLSEEAEKARKAMDDARSLQLALSKKDVEVQSLTVQRSHEQSVDETLQQGRKMDEVMRENMDIKRRYEAEQLMRREEEDKRHQLLQKMKFEQQVYEQQCRDLQQRIESSTNTILELESRLHSVELPPDLASILEQVRDAADRELQRYKTESEEAFNRTVNMLKAQMEADGLGFQALASENRRLLNSVEELNAANHRLQSEVSHLQHLKLAAEENLRLERANAEKHIVSLENKLKDFQEMLFEKLREFNSARDAVPVLRTEIDSIRRLLQDEQARSLLPPSIAAYGSEATTIPALADDRRENQVVREAHDALGWRASSRPSSAAAPAILGNVSPRRPHSGGPVGPITSARPAAAYGSQDITSLEVSEQKIPSDQRQASDIQDAHASPAEGGIVPLNEDSKPAATAAYDYNVQTNSATGAIKIFEVHPGGKYVRLRNYGLKDIDISGYIVQQSVGGQPVAVYRFPSRTPLQAGSFVTVHSGTNDSILHQPPSEFVWTEQEKWGTGPECTTIVCKPNGQAIAWMTAAHRFGNLEYPHAGSSSAADRPKTRSALDNGLLPVYQRDPNKQKETIAYLRRERTSPPVLTAQKHPHGEPPSRATHPLAHERRPLIMGNDHSSNNPQSRSQSQTPDLIPGQPYAGASGQRMGSANLLRFVATQHQEQQPQQQKGNIRKNGALAKQARVGMTAPPPSSFMKPRSKFQFGLEQLRSQQHHDFLPPMPRPPLFAAW